MLRAPIIPAGEGGVEEPRHRLSTLVNVTRDAARHDLEERAFDAFAAHFFDEMESVQTLVLALRQGPRPLPSLHNWVAFQDLLASLSATGRWPRHAQSGLCRMAACLNLLAKRRPRQKAAALQPAADPSMAKEDPPW